MEDAAQSNQGWNILNDAASRLPIEARSAFIADSRVLEGAFTSGTMGEHKYKELLKAGLVISAKQYIRIQILEAFRELMSCATTEGARAYLEAKGWIPLGRHCITHKEGWTTLLRGTKDTVGTAGALQAQIQADVLAKFGDTQRNMLAAVVAWPGPPPSR